MKTNDIKKGMVVRLNNGWMGIMADNMRGNTRMVDVDGLYREMGSVYSHDIELVWPSTKLKLQAPLKGVQFPDGLRVIHTPAQVKLRKKVGQWI